MLSTLKFEFRTCRIYNLLMQGGYNIRLQRNETNVGMKFSGYRNVSIPMWSWDLRIFLRDGFNHSGLLCGMEECDNDTRFNYVGAIYKHIRDSGIDMKVLDLLRENNIEKEGF